MTPRHAAAQAGMDAVHTAWATKYGPSPIAAAALRAVAHEIDWESGDPKFLVLAIAAELKDINHSE